MLAKKKIIFTILSVVIASFIIYIGIGIFDYLEFRKVAISAGGMPWQDGGMVTYYNSMCVIEDPVFEPTICHTCLMCSSAIGSLCASSEEIQFTGQLGGTKVCPSKGFVYKGGGTMPTMGQNMIVGGASDILPYVIGVPGVSAMRIKKAVDWFDFIIAGIKE